MVVNREFTVTCRGCGKPFKLYEYKSLVGRYGDHWCPELRELLMTRPRLRKYFKEPQKHIE